MLYKFTRSDHTTMNNMRWGEDVQHDVGVDWRLQKPLLCSGTVIHAYRSPEQAVLMRPAHCAVYSVLWEAKGRVVVDDGTKVGCRSLTTLRVVELPKISDVQKVKIIAGVLLSRTDLHKKEKQVLTLLRAEGTLPEELISKFYYSCSGCVSSFIQFCCSYGLGFKAPGPYTVSEYLYNNKRSVNVYNLIETVISEG